MHRTVQGSTTIPDDKGTVSRERWSIRSMHTHPVPNLTLLMSVVCGVCTCNRFNTNQPPVVEHTIMRLWQKRWQCISRNMYLTLMKTFLRGTSLIFCTVIFCCSIEWSNGLLVIICDNSSIQFNLKSLALMKKWFISVSLYDNSDKIHYKVKNKNSIRVLF